MCSLRLTISACLLSVLGCGGTTQPVDPPADSAAKSAAKSTTLPVAEPAETTAAHGADDPNRQANRLGAETSPYLRLHMYNPVDWYAWGPEAFAKAKKENKPIFLSVGYSSCYWCHVMERESFMDDEIAAMLNKHFVCIKVDREERPDVDSIYMLAVQILTRRGGWPMSVFMTPEGKPFFGGTYFPARDGDRRGTVGFLTILQRLDQVWKQQPQTLLETADKLTNAIQQEMAGPAETTKEFDADLVQKVKASLASGFDDQYGGFGFNPADPQSNKFPEASNLMFLLSCIEQQKDADCLRMLTKTLDQMAMGGIYDHVGGGFHRYSVDRFWHIPHFEKMLYDNGQLLSVYSRAYKLTSKPLYRRVVEQTIEFMLREMRAEGGAFVSALDAESEQVEGKFYRWELAELKTLLAADFDRMAAVYGLTGEPNFEHDFYVPQLATPWEQLAKAAGFENDDALDASLQPLRTKLLAARETRPRPLTDEKILASWNGLAIRGLADAGRLLDRPEYTAAAASAADFVMANLRGDKGRLLRTYTAGEAKLNAYLDDYAFLADGLIALHQATGDAKWLQQAGELTDQMITLYADDERGAFFFTTSDHESLIARSKQLTDGAQPSGNSLAASNLIYLAKALDNDRYRQFGERTVRNVVPLIERFPRAAPRMAAVVVE